MSGASDTGALARLARRMGVLDVYTDQTGKKRETGDDTRAHLLTAFGLPGGDEAAAARELDSLEAEDAARRLPLWMVVEAGQPVSGDDPGAWTVEMEDGETRHGEGWAALGKLPLGIHKLDCGGHVTWLLAAPASLPEPALDWGVTLPLYGLRTPEQGGVGTYADLRTALSGLGAAGAGFAGVNPIHAGFPEDPANFSPYAPSSRRRFSTLHVDAGAQATGGDLIDYADAVPAQGRALAEAWPGAGREGAGFAEWRAKQGEPLELFALHQAISEEHGAYWSGWPEDLHDPAGQAARDFARAHADRVSFHAWAQWMAETQLAAVRDAGADMSWGLYLDLAVGTHPHGAETWAEPDLFARGVSLGAPPDDFSADGQTWGLAPLRPDALARAGFRPLAETLRAQLHFARILRIDHILGFERAFWVPDNHAAPGAYVQMPKAALLAVVRIEAARVGAVVIGEDLGNIPDGLREDLDASGVMGCRVAMFEQHWDEPGLNFKLPEEYDRLTLTSFSTHDLPTWEGWKVGRDIEWRRDLGSMEPGQADKAKEERGKDVWHLGEKIHGDAHADMLRYIARSPARLVAVQIEDILGLTEQPNLPGTIDEHPNWRRRLPVPVDRLGQLDATGEVARIMTDADRGRPTDA